MSMTPFPFSYHPNIHPKASDGDMAGCMMIRPLFSHSHHELAPMLILFYFRYALYDY